jgi:Brix domain
MQRSTSSRTYRCDGCKASACVRMHRAIVQPGCAQARHNVAHMDAAHPSAHQRAPEHTLAAAAQVMKELLQQVFVTPKGHQKSKPFFDHVISFTYCDNRVWLRNYQVIVALDKKKVTDESVTLVEVGPRATLQPIKVRTCRPAQLGTADVHAPCPWPCTVTC